MKRFSKEQLTDATGQLANASQGAGLRFEHDRQEIRYPTFQKIAETVGGDTNKGNFMLPKVKEKLRTVQGATVIAGVSNRGIQQFFPGKVLPDGRIGLLSTTAAVRDKQTIAKPLNDIEKLLLSKFYIEQCADLEHHERNVNVAKIGIGVLVAAAVTPVGLHDTVHIFDHPTHSGNIDLPEKILANQTTGRLSIPTDHGDYPVGFRVIESTQTAGLVVIDAHQFPSPGLSANSFELTAGLTHAIRTLQGVPNQLGVKTQALLEPVSK